MKSSLGDRIHTGTDHPSSLATSSPYLVALDLVETTRTAQPLLHSTGQLPEPSSRQPAALNTAAATRRQLARHPLPARSRSSCAAPHSAQVAATAARGPRLSHCSDPCCATRTTPRCDAAERIPQFCVCEHGALFANTTPCTASSIMMGTMMGAASRRYGICAGAVRM